jgi:formylglycine-generating enzyme required for sulfatase activity
MHLPQEYLDFELEIGEGSGHVYPVAVVHSPAGEVHGFLHFPFNDLELENHLLALQVALLRSGSRRRRVSAEEREVRAFGQALFESLMSGTVGTLYYASQREAERAGKGLRIKLRILSPWLAALPWEFLYDPLLREYVCLSSHTPLVRTPAVAQPPRLLTVTPPLRILGMIANPHDLEDLDVDLERQRVEMALQDLRGQRVVELVWLAGQTWRDLQRALRRDVWHAFHFIGHGGYDTDRGEGLLMLANSRGQSHPLHATELGRLLANHASLRLVLLNACEGARASNVDIFSSTAGTLIRRGIPAVVAMQYEITDRAAIEFVRAFYEALADALPVDTAMTEARVAMSLAVRNSFEWGVPVLHMRAPHGHLFDLQKETIIPAGQEEAVPERQVPEPDRWSRDRQRIWIFDEDDVEENAGSAASSAGDRETGSSAEIDWVFIPGGEFLMGSNRDQDPMAVDDELPQHVQNLRAFAIARTPVTNLQYKAFTDATGHRTPPHWKERRIPAGREQHPVVYVSWYDASAYCAWLSARLDRVVRLPTEAEWEKAARGADGRIYPWGNEPPHAQFCNFGDARTNSTPVGSYPAAASPWGVHDMAGNVDEWTHTLYRDYPYRADDGRENPEIDLSRVLRGGSFDHSLSDIRCAARGSNFPAAWEDFIGFRVGMGGRMSNA